MSSYFQRLAAQTWNAPASTAPAPGSDPSSESLLETTEEVTAPSAAIVSEPAMGTAAPLPGSTPPAAHAPAQESPAPFSSSAESHSILPPGEPISSKPPTKPPLPGTLGTLLPSTPIMEEVVRWLATPAGPTAPAAPAPPIASKSLASKAQPVIAQSSIAPKSGTPPEISAISYPLEREEIPEVVIRHEAVSEESLPPVASRPATPAPFRADKARETAKRRESPVFEEIVSLHPPPQPEVTVKIGTIQVTIESPAQPAVRTVERPAAPAPSRATGSSARAAASNLSRHYITTF